MASPFSIDPVGSLAFVPVFAMILSAALVGFYMRWELGIFFTFSAYIILAILVPDAFYSWMENTFSFFFMAFVALPLVASSAAIAVRLDLKEFLVLPIIIAGFNVVVAVGVVEPELGCSSPAAYGASISYICANLMPEGYVFMCVMLTVISTIAQRESDRELSSPNGWPRTPLSPPFSKQK